MKINNKQKESLNKAWEMFLNNENFETGLIAIGVKMRKIIMSGDKTADEYINWFSPIAQEITSGNGTISLTEEEKLHFMAMYRSFILI